MEFKARGVQGGPSIICEGTTHGRTVTADDFGFWVVPFCKASFNGAYTADTLLEFFFGMPVRLVDRFRGFLEIMKVTELMRHLGRIFPLALGVIFPAIF